MKNLQDLIKARPSEFRLQKISWNIEKKREPFLSLQFTGFTDKNGKKIFDGDILQTDDVPNVLVYWNQLDGRWSCRFALNYDKDCELNDSARYISCVIGNIFENPEMMEVEPIYAKRFLKKDSNVDYFDYELVNDLIMEKGNEQTRQQWWNFIEKVNHL